MEKTKRNALRKDFFMEIRKSMGRFLSIFFIVALGVSLFVGISATEPDMTMSGDAYADENKLMDIKVVSTYGLTEDDLEVISRLPSIDTAVGSYSTDVLCEVDDNMKVLHVMANLEDMNTVTVTEGYLPKNPDECLVDEDFLAATDYELGDMIELVSGTDADLDETLKYTKLRIVGCGNSPLYFSVDRGSSTIGNGSVSGFLIVHPDTFDLEVYTEIYATVDGAEEVRAYSEEYDELIEEALEHIELIQNVRCEVRRDELAKEAQLEIDNARNELNEKKQEAEEQIQDNEDKLNAAELEISLGEIQIQSGKAQIESGKAQIESSKAQVESGKAEIESGKAEIESGWAEIESGKAELESGKKEIESGWAELESGKAQIESSKAQLESGKAEIESAWAELEAGKKELEESKQAYETALAPLKEQKQELEKQLSEWETKASELDDIQKEIALGTIQGLRETMNFVDEQISSLTSGFEEEFEAGEKQIAEAEELLKEKEKEIEAAEQEIAAAEKELAAAEKKLVAAEQEIAKAEEEIEAGEKELAAAEKEIEAGEKELAAAEKEIAAAEKELAASEKELKASESQISSGKNEIASGKEQLEDAKKEMEEQLAEGEAKLDEAEEEISNLELPTWYIFDRSSIPEYSGFGDNAARIGALSIVFPSIFFLVAALISLTTMTRMVEEQRVQIGTLKALGYSNGAIISKYLCYALSATLGGSIFGFLVGEKLFPFVIIKAYYLTVYTHLPYVLLPYQWGYAIAATLIAVLCTGGAAVVACYKELAAQPAVLMRPEAPKVGKRTLIERIPFLWKHLNFSWKSSLRNLFRYKKRFFMTLFGIGGCMGLLMVGFGLRDSITSIADHQYGELHLYDNSIFISDSMKKKERNSMLTYLEENEEVSCYMNVRMASMTAENEDEKVDVYITVVEDLDMVEEFFIYRDRKTHEGYTLSEEGVILTEKAANMLGADVGDTILLSEEGRNEKKVKITDICENYAGHYVYMTDGLYEELYDEEPFYNTVLVKVKEGTTSEQIEEIGEDVLEFDDVLNVQYTATLSGQLNDMLVALDSVMVLLILVAGMLSFVVLYNLNNINITERRRELATLKVLGFFDLEVANYVYRENILLTLLGVAVGCILGRFLHYFTIITVEVDMAMFGREVSLYSYAMCALFTIGFSALVNWIMYFKLKKINMVESLKSVE